MIVNKGPPSLLLLSNDKEGNAFPTRHPPSNAEAIATTTATAIVTTAADNEDNDNNNVRIPPPPQPTAAVGCNTVKVAGTMSKQVAVLSVISSAAKISLHAYFEGSNWPLNC
jgi:hypothetical protein